jgi:uncharacterized protein YutE (UPF0331/DUF86 family)
MVDPDLLRRKTSQVLHHLTRLRRHSALSAEALLADEDFYNALVMDLQQAIQACIDLAAHACADAALGVPSSPAEAFSLLARAGLIDVQLAVRLAGAAGLRNLIVHRYTDLDAQRIVDVVRNNLGDLEALVKALHASPA